MTDAYHTPMDCSRVEALASARVDGELDRETRTAMERHLDGCEPCANLVADLAALAAEARALPALAPSRDLWAGIAARIEAPVVALDPARVTRAPSRGWWKAAAAAAVLVATTAGVTWQLATARARQDLVARAPQPADSAMPVAPAPVTHVAVVDSGTGRPSVPDEEEQATPRTRPAPRFTPGTQPRATPRPVGRPAVVPVALPAAAQAYGREIDGMRSLLAERREQLDPVTVRVLDRNLRIIDEAIAESRAALAQDPASGLLAEQLTRAMRRKLELLRTAAGVPARTS